MTAVSIMEHLTGLNAAIQALESGAERRKASAQQLAEVKRTLDDVRLRLWALLETAQGDDPQVFADQFRVRRVTELCVRITTDLRSGLINPAHTAFADLWIAAVDLSQTIQAAREKTVP